MTQKSFLLRLIVLVLFNLIGAGVGVAISHYGFTHTYGDIDNLWTTPYGKGSAQVIDIASTEDGRKRIYTVTLQSKELTRNGKKEPLVKTWELTSDRLYQHVKENRPLPPYKMLLKVRYKQHKLSGRVSVAKAYKHKFYKKFQLKGTVIHVGMSIAGLMIIFAAAKQTRKGWKKNRNQARLEAHRQKQKDAKEDTSTPENEPSENETANS